MAENIPKEIILLIEKSVDNTIDNYTIDVHEGNKKGEGYLGEILFVSLKEKTSGKDIHIIIKQAVLGPYSQEFVSATYVNEIGFYTKIWPAIDEFQKLHLGEENIIDNVAKCYFADSTKGSEKVVLDNLKFQNYQLHPKAVPLDFSQLSAIFKLYGKYHGTWFALRKLDSAKFSDLSKIIDNNWVKFFKMFPGTIGGIFGKIKTLFDPKTDTDLLEKFKKYHETGDEVFFNSVDCDGPSSIMVHGDCWSNNVLFKFNESKELENIKLIDFQMSFVGSPVHDLSYSMYSNAGKSELERLEELLKIYHDSLSETLQKYGLDPDSTYSFETLKSEWKKYCAFGFIVGVLVVNSKENPNERLRAVVRHLHEKDYL